MPELNTMMADANVPMSRVKITLMNRLLRFAWNIVWIILFRPTPRAFHSWRTFLLKTFGAQISTGVHVYPSAKVWAPWNLEMGSRACLADEVNCYNVAKVTIGEGSTVSQYSFLCTASHDYRLTTLPLVAAPIRVNRQVWIAADVFVAPGVEIGDDTVVVARSTVLKSMPDGVVVAGHPAVPSKIREIVK